MKQDTISLWRERIADKKASGLNLEDWCAQNQLTKHSYYYWKRKISDLNHKGSFSPLFVEIPTAPQRNGMDTTHTPMIIEWKDLSI